jgi:hypothetical protein
MDKIKKAAKRLAVGAALLAASVGGVIYGNGPGVGIWAKNYRAYDAWCDGNGNYGGDWFGPWRLKKSSAQGDAARHNGLFG